MKFIELTIDPTNTKLYINVNKIDCFKTDDYGTTLYVGEETIDVIETSDEIMELINGK